MFSTKTIMEACIVDSLYDLVKIQEWMNKENYLLLIVILLAMALPITSKLGMLALMITALILIGTLLFLIIEHNKQIVKLQDTISHLCIDFIFIRQYQYQTLHGARTSAFQLSECELLS